ncbi:MAG: hypothetical protein QOF56_1093 [Acidobacteriaceae bacterium]|jgi:hypothetical protein|nr:hypothetical protein [Acidobacteriaceae bacterium]
MIIPETPPSTLWPPKTISSDEDERLDHALENLVKENQWIDDFIRRINYTIEDIVRKT